MDVIVVGLGMVLVDDLLFIVRLSGVRVVMWVVMDV